MNKKIPLRKCVITEEQLPKKELLRIIKDGDLIIIDETGKKNGHGVYMKKDLETILKAQKNKKLEQIFQQKLDVKFYDDLKKII